MKAPRRDVAVPGTQSPSGRLRISASHDQARVGKVITLQLLSAWSNSGPRWYSTQPNGCFEMVPLDQSIDELRVELRLARLKVIQLEDELAKRDTASKEADQSTQLGQPKYPLTKEQYQRYGRQMILPSVGLQGKPALLCGNSRG